jgi:hypothetical protein
MLHDSFLLSQRVQWEPYLVLINHTIQQDCPLNNTRIAAQQPQLPLSEVAKEAAFTRKKRLLFFP